GVGLVDVNIWYHRRCSGCEPSHRYRSLNRISSVFRLKWIRHAPGIPHRRGKPTVPVQSASAARTLSFSTRVPSEVSRNSADEISIGPFTPRIVARTLCSRAVPVTSGKEKPDGVPETFPAHAPAFCNSIWAEPSTLAFTAGKPSRVANRSVCDTSPSP